VFENVRGPITEHALTYVRGKMPGDFVDIAGITARTQKLVYNTRTEPTPRGIGSFTPNMFPILKDEKTNLLSMLLQ